MGKLIREREAGPYIGKPAKTLANWRSLGKGPAYIKFEGTVRYDTDDLDAYIGAHRVEPRMSRGDAA